MDGHAVTEHGQELVEYALGELDPETAARVARHLEGCERCRAELLRIEEALGWLGTAVPQVDPSPALRARVLATAAFEGRQRWRLAWARGLLAAAAVLLVFALLLAVTRADRQADELAARQANIAAVLAAADWSTAMQGERVDMPAQVGRVYLDREGRTGLLVLAELPLPDEGRVYQVWLIRSDGGRDSAGVFLPDLEGRALLVIHARDPWTTYQGMGITVEPGPEGSAQPTGERIAGCTWDWEAWATHDRIARPRLDAGHG